MAKITIEELYRGDGYDIMGAVTAKALTLGIDERTEDGDTSGRDLLKYFFHVGTLLFFEILLGAVAGCSVINNVEPFCTAAVFVEITVALHACTFRERMQYRVPGACVGSHVEVCCGLVGTGKRAVRSVFRGGCFFGAAAGVAFDF